MRIIVKNLFFLILTILTGITGCNESGNKSALYQGLSECPQVAELKQVGEHLVTVCNPELLKDTVVLPLSYFTDELQIIKLDNRPDAIVSETAATIGDNYVLISNHWNSKTPYKLFNKSGKFITNIGAFGKGPNEYQHVSDQQLDETNKRIYLLPSSSDKVLVYDLDGRHSASIRLVHWARRGVMRIDYDRNIVSVVTQPVIDGKFASPTFAWSQTLTGEFINGIAPGYLSLNPKNLGLSLLFSSGNTDTGNLDFHITRYKDICKDTLYHFNTDENELIPQFTIDFGQQIPIHFHAELPLHFLTGLAESKEVLPNQWLATIRKYFLVDKVTLKGAYFKLKNDFLSGVEFDPIFSSSNGYYVANYEPAKLLEKLETALSNNVMSSEMRKKVTDLKNSIRETDNNYILYAKLKQ